MRVFISGVAGFLGSHLADAILCQGDTVIGTDNLIGGYRDNVPSEVEFHEADCLDMEKMSELMRGCDLVYNCACTAYEGLSVFSPNLIMKNTYQLTVSLATAAIKNKVGRFVQCSSMARYGKQERFPFTEDMIPMPVDPYGLAKLGAEQVLRMLCEIHGMDYVIVVPHNIIGPRQKYDDPFRNVASIMMNLSLQGRGHIIYGDGEQKRCFSYVDDVLDCLLKAGEVSAAIGEVINIGPDEEFVTINELSMYIRNLVGGLPHPAQYYPDRPREVKMATCSAEKARAILGYSTKTPLIEGLQHMLTWMRGRGAKPFEYHLPIEITNKETPKTWTDKLF